MASKMKQKEYIEKTCRNCKWLDLSTQIYGQYRCRVIGYEIMIDEEDLDTDCCRAWKPKEEEAKSCLNCKFASEYKQSPTGDKVLCGFTGYWWETFRLCSMYEEKPVCKYSDKCFLCYDPKVSHINCEAYEAEEPELKVEAETYGGFRVGSMAVTDSNDNINHPSHYTHGNIEVIDFIEDQKMSFCEGAVVKYLCRYKYKGTPLDDLKKAKWFLERLIKEQEA